MNISNDTALIAVKALSERITDLTRQAGDEPDMAEEYTAQAIEYTECLHSIATARHKAAMVPAWVVGHSMFTARLLDGEEAA